MLFYNNFFDNLIILYSYMFVYNMSLFLIFWLLNQIVNLKFKTLFAFNDLKINFFFLITITFILFSIAGVPPFLGFFSKILILVSLLNSNFFFIYLLFFILLFFGLYFYLQNIRFLYSISKGKLDYSYNINLRTNIYYSYWASITVFFLIFGMFFFDDMLNYFYWIFL